LVSSGGAEVNLTSGCTVSTIQLYGELGALGFPARSMARTISVCGPSATVKFCDLEQVEVTPSRWQLKRASGSGWSNSKCAVVSPLGFVGPWETVGATGADESSS
jgi:hypothetical protein